MISALLVTLSITATLCVTGTLSQFDRAPTLAVIANRSVPNRTAYTLPSDWRERYDGLIAVESCADLGREYDVYWRDKHARVLAFDCSGHASTTAWMRRNRIVGEIDFSLARRWKAKVGRGMRNAIMCEVKR